MRLEIFRGSGWLMLGVALAAAACSPGAVAAPELPRTGPNPRQVDLIFSNLPGSSFHEVSPREWDFAAPHHLRPCCILGYGLRVELGSVPLPGVRLANIVEHDRIGRHSYDPSAMAFDNGIDNGFLSPEINGLTYTCRGGFIDIAHVRDYADWTVYLTGRVESLLDSGGVVELPAEGGQRFVYVVAPGDLLIERVGRRDLAIVLAQWLAFQLSIWHETATWYHWSTWSAFSEEASAFSPEDFYSNMVGINIAGEIIRTSSVVTKRQYDRNMSPAIDIVLRRLGAMPAIGTRYAADSVDGTWWDSTQRLPSKGLLLRRNFNVGPLLVPWTVPRRLYTDGMKAAVESYCDGAGGAAALVAADSVEGIPIRNLVRLDVRVDPRVARSIPSSAGPGRWMSQDDVVALVAVAHAENAREFGPRADRPD